MSEFPTEQPSEEHRLLARIGFRSEVDWAGALPRAMVQEQAFKDPIVDGQGARVAPLAVINAMGPSGGYELRLMNYDVGQRWLDALIKADSFTELNSAVYAAIPEAVT